MNKEETRAYNKRYREKNKEKLKAYEKKRSQTKKRKDASKKYREKPDVKERVRKHRQTPEFKAHLKKYRQTPKRKAQRKEYQRKNRESINARSRAYAQRPEWKAHTRKYRKERREEFLLKCKKGKSCAFCGYKEYPEILQFHHKDKKEKSFNVANKVRSRASLQAVKAEIDKCILLCPNCHNWLHFKESRKNREHPKGRTD